VTCQLDGRAGDDVVVSRNADCCEAEWYVERRSGGCLTLFVCLDYTRQRATCFFVTDEKSMYRSGHRMFQCLDDMCRRYSCLIPTRAAGDQDQPGSAVGAALSLTPSSSATPFLFFLTYSTNRLSSHTLYPHYPLFHPVFHVNHVGVHDAPCLSHVYPASADANTPALRLPLHPIS
jgi:hypothetical protein